MSKPLFVIFGTHGRCGTKWLADCLQPAVHMSPRGEIWQPHQIERARQLGSPHPFEEPIPYLRWWCKRQGPECRGAKAFPYFFPPGSDEQLALGVDRVIFVYRRNLTEQMVSLAVASKAGWSKHRQHDPDEPFAVDIDLAIANAEQSVKQWRRCVEVCEAHRRKYCVVSYEDLTQPIRILQAVPDDQLPLAEAPTDATVLSVSSCELEVTSEADSLRAFVGLPPLPADFSSRFEVQRSPERYRRLISNYDEIQERMGERYGRLFGPPGSFNQVEGL